MKVSSDNPLVKKSYEAPQSQKKEVKRPLPKIKPKLDLPAKKLEKIDIPGDPEEAKKLQSEIQKNNEEARKYLRSLNVESYTVRFVKGKGIVVQGGGKNGNVDLRG